MSMIDRLRDELETAKEENAQLKEEIGIIQALPHPSKLKSFGITPSGFRLLCVLSKKKVVLRDTIFRVLWPNDVEEPDSAIATIHVQLSRLRKKLDLEIPNIWHQGWYLNDADRLRVNSILKELLK